MEIIATKLKARELLPGDLFSTADQNYWDSAMKSGTVGEKVYIRMYECGPEDQQDMDIYRIEVVR